MKKITVLYITHYPLLYGANRSLLSMINAIKDSITPVVVIPEKGPVCKILEKQKIKYCIIPFGVPFYFKQQITFSFLWKMALKTVTYPFLHLQSMLKLYKCIKENNVQLIHSNSSIITVGYRIGRFMKIRHIWHLREFQDKDYDLLPYFWHKPYMKNLYRKSIVISVSKALAKYYSLENQAKVIYNSVSINPDNAGHKRKKDNYFLFCGLVHKNKGIEDTINAFILLNKTFPQYQLYVVGEIEEAYKDELTAIAQTAGCEKSICFFGMRKKDEVFQFMQKAKALIMSSKNEAMGRVTVEAMLNKCLVIGYDNAGTAELVDDNNTGLLYVTEEELLQKMEYVIKNEKDVIRIEENAYNYAMNNFSEKIYAEKLMTIYNGMD
jgi:glycosyltransferase involved in cell wall biosynthesis